MVDVQPFFGGEKKKNDEKRNGGEGGIRTPGTILLVQRFSKPPL
jgi:hypothetical protein